MPGRPNRMSHAASLRILVLSLTLLFAEVAAPTTALAQTAADAAETGADAPDLITNLAQLVRALNAAPRLVAGVDLKVTVCNASRPDIGVVVAQDETGVELLELGPRPQALLPGDRVEIQQPAALLRRRDLGVKISAVPVVDNDGIHGQETRTGKVRLTAGKHAVELDWFNQFRDLVLEVTCQTPDAAPEQIPAAALWHLAGDGPSGRTNYQPGLRVKCYEGYWVDLPDFELLRPARIGVATNCDLQFRTQDDMVGLQFAGFFDAPRDGIYTFSVRSDDGSLLFLGNPAATVAKRGETGAPVARSAAIGELMTDLDARRWVSVEGQVNFVRETGQGLELELRSDRNTMGVKIADAAGLDPARLQNARVRVTGVGRGILNLDQRIVLGQLAAADAGALELLNTPADPTAQTQLLTTVRQVQTMRLEDARRGVPVRIRGVVTSVGRVYDRWVSLQDDTRGIFVNTRALTNALPACGDYWEIVGHSSAGDFAPIIVAESGSRLGEGRLPEPARPSWNELINGSLDVQWVEFQGLVTAVHSNMLSLYQPGGRATVELREDYESELKPFENSLVRIRGVLYAVWDSNTRELQVGKIKMHNASISLVAPAPADPFDAVLKTPGELLQFDAQANAFRRMKVRGQVLHADAGRIFLMDDKAGLRILPASAAAVRAGDLVEAVGFPEINGVSVLLREAIVRKTGAAVLPPARVLTDKELTFEGLDSTWVRVQGTLLGWHYERGAPVLEMQSGQHLYLARLGMGQGGDFSLRAGSRLALNGIYVGPGRNPQPGFTQESFELLLNSPADITVLSQPSWWTLQRLLIIVGILLVVLVFAMVWITQLRRLVEQRTAQLHCETCERERIQRWRDLEAERSRIARDLHDDLGSSLTEIGVLATTGQRPRAEESTSTALFQSIAAKARGLIAALDVIVWAVDPEDNSLQSLADYLSGFAGEYLSHSNLACRFKVPVTFPPVTLDGQVRHGLLMAVKETLNNVVRHANATEVEFRMAVENDALDITIADNGRGFAGVPERDGHGLKNLPARLTKLGGSCRVESRAGAGTTVSLRLPLPAPDAPGAGAASN